MLSASLSLTAITSSLLCGWDDSSEGRRWGFKDRNRKKKKEKQCLCYWQRCCWNDGFFFLTLQSDSVCFLFISLSWVWRALFWLVSIWSRSCSAERSCSCRPICLLCIWFYSRERKRWRVLVQQVAVLMLTVSSLANKVFKLNIFRV